MRALVFLVMLLAFGARAQTADDAFEITQRFANSGAPQIALTRIDRLQPALPTALRWSDWEQLRCSLMFRLKRHQELVQRVSVLPSGASATVARSCLAQGARAAIAISQAAVARSFLARLIWLQAQSADEMREARLLVIESYLAQNNAQDAYVLMLRYQQDFRPIDRDTAARFVEALLAAGMEKEAVNWFSQLDDASPVKLRARLAAGLITPDAAIAQARAALTRSGNNAAWWSVLQYVAASHNNRLLRVEALENLLQLADDKLPAIAAELWKSYTVAAQDIANQNQFLVGDDANWADYASRRLATSPVAARALYAHLAQQGKASATRQNAQLQLVFSLQGSKLGLAALRLFDDAARFPMAQLDSQARYLLGGLALENDQAVTAARFWQGLGAPPALASDEWQIRLAQTLVHAGVAGAGVDALRALIAGKKALPAGMVQRAIVTVQELQDTTLSKTADELYRALLPLADTRERRDILYGLGRIAESNRDFRGAADHFLEAALLGDGRVPDAAAINARIAAATNLGRAGLKDDARMQFAWLQKNVKDTEKLELVRREMGKL